MRVALLAGEPSGDQLGAALMQALKQQDSNIEFDGIGGELMAAEGLNSLIPMEGFSVMGISEIVKALPRLLGYKKRLLQHFSDNPPDVFIGIDYPEFNFKIEKALKDQGVFTVHYVSPSVWAWREKRIVGIKAACDLMLTLFAFEKTFYDKHQLPAVHCGHPLVDIIGKQDETLSARITLNLSENGQYLAILPGSRHSEVQRMLPIFTETADKIASKVTDVTYLIPAATPSLHHVIHTYLQENAPQLTVHITTGQGKTVMRAADAVLLASGTAALEAMLLQKPMLVSYKVSKFTAFLAKRLIRTRYFSLPNLLADKAIVPEFMQDDINTDTMAETLTALLTDNVVRQAMIDELIATRQPMKGQAAETAAHAILTAFKERQQ